MADDITEPDKELYKEFLRVHLPQLKKNEIPELHWKCLFAKLKHELYDAGEFFSIMQEEEEEETYKVVVTNEDGIKCSDPRSIFLIDHAWTYELPYARKQLHMYPTLAGRMAALMGVKPDGEEGNEAFLNSRLDGIIEQMWRFNLTYKSQSLNQLSSGDVQYASEEEEDKISLWYILDEFGSRIQHSDEPTCKMALFYFAPMGMSFSVIWLTSNLEYGDALTRDYAPEVKDPLQRIAALFPWQPCDIEEETKMHSISNEEKPSQKSEDGGRLFETLPDPKSHHHRKPKDGVLTVFCDIDQIRNSLTDPRFKLVDNMEEADILSPAAHWKDYRRLCDTGQYIMQFPGESTITCKDLLARVCQRNGPRHDARAEEKDDLLCRGPYWLPVTYNINTELVDFVKHYKRREKRGLDNHWICKPWNKGRGLDLHVSKNLIQIIRLAETGPKVCCKYLENPVLFHRDDIGPVKFDVRYMLYVTSLDPIVLYVDRIFWLRFANKPFELGHYEEYERHCTVMNYGDYVLKQVHHYEFIPLFNSQYPNHKWEDVEAEFFEVFKELFQASVKELPPNGMAPCNQARAYYSTDTMVKWADDGSDRIVPQILEFNYNSDCLRYLKYYPDFFNFLFSLFFYDDPMGWPITRLL